MNRNTQQLINIAVNAVNAEEIIITNNMLDKIEQLINSEANFNTKPIYWIIAAIRQVLILNSIYVNCELSNTIRDALESSITYKLNYNKQ